MVCVVVFPAVCVCLASHPNPFYWFRNEDVSVCACARSLLLSSPQNDLQKEILIADVGTAILTYLGMVVD